MRCMHATRSEAGAGSRSQVTAATQLLQYKLYAGAVHPPALAALRSNVNKEIRLFNSILYHQHPIAHVAMLDDDSALTATHAQRGSASGPTVRRVAHPRLCLASSSTT